LDESHLLGDEIGFREGDRLVFRVIGGLVIIFGLAWVYTALYGGPASGFFGMLDSMVPSRNGIAIKTPF
jgi:hypothetical protein